MNNYTKLIPQNIGYQISFALQNYHNSSQSKWSIPMLGLQIWLSGRLKDLSLQFEVLRSINTFRNIGIIVLTPLVLEGIKRTRLQNYSGIKIADRVVTDIYSYSDIAFNTVFCVYYLALTYFGERVGGIIGIATLTLLALNRIYSPPSSEQERVNANEIAQKTNQNERSELKSPFLQIVSTCDSLIKHHRIVFFAPIVHDVSLLYRNSAPWKNYTMPIIYPFVFILLEDKISKIWDNLNLQSLDKIIQNIQRASSSPPSNSSKNINTKKRPTLMDHLSKVKSS